MKARVLFFATFRDRVGARAIEMELPDGSRVAELKTRLQVQYPVLAELMSSALVSVNREFAFNEDVLAEGAEVAIFPPVSGGVHSDYPTFVAITEQELDINALLSQISLPTSGAACFFTGMVRGVTQRGDAHATAYLEYEAYQPMAEEKLRQVADEMRQRWPSLQGVVVIQRIGRLDPGTPTVLVACSAAHRDTGVFEAARYGIDRLKEIVPVWKKEVGPQGEAWVEGKYIPERTDTVDHG
ncbi:MAG: molybdenum cofactor biosynthesis protein MoaE [Chloroflexota bacterium]